MATSNWILFKRSLAQHPGHLPAIVITLLSGMACYGRGGLFAALVGSFGMAVPLWAVIFVTAWDMRRLFE